METEERKKAAERRKKRKKPERERRSMYDVSDIVAASEAAYDKNMDEEELRIRRRRDWIALLIGIPAFIGIIYLIVYLYRRG